MEVFVIRTTERNFGVCYHGRDGVCERDPVNAVKYATLEAAKRVVGDEIMNMTHEIIPMTIEYTLHEEDKTVIKPESIEAE